VTQLFHLWVYLEKTPLLGLTATLIVWRLALEMNVWARGHALAHPVPIAITLLVLLLLATGTPYSAYFQGAQYIHFLLGPATVALAIAMGIAEAIGGDPSLTAVFVLLTGIVAGLMAVPALRMIGVRDWRAIGLAAGTAGHGLATARVLLVSETAGAFGGVAIGLNGVITAMLAPLLATMFAR